MWSDGNPFTTPFTSPSSHIDASYGMTNNTTISSPKGTYVFHLRRFSHRSAGPSSRENCERLNHFSNLTPAKNSALRLHRLSQTNELDRLGEGWQNLGLGESHHVSGSCKPAGKKTSHEVCAGYSRPITCHRSLVPMAWRLHLGGSQLGDRAAFSRPQLLARTMSAGYIWTILPCRSSPCSWKDHQSGSRQR